MSELDDNRPYPPGVAFDEAWRQRQRADQLENKANRLRLALHEITDYAHFKGPVMNGDELARKVIEIAQHGLQQTLEQPSSIITSELLKALEACVEQMAAAFEQARINSEDRWPTLEDARDLIAKAKGN